jgi:hypothetical protein
MKIEVITNDTRLRASIDRYFKFVLADLSSLEGRVYIVDVATVLNNNSASYQLLTKVKELVSSKKFVILLSPDNEEVLKKNNLYFSGFMSYANVGYVNALNMKSLCEACFHLLNPTKKDDLVGIEFFHLEKLESQTAALSHGMEQKILDEVSRKVWLQKARELGFIGSDDEVIVAVKDWKPETAGRFLDKHLDGIFVDAFETLFNVNWELDEEIKKALEDLSEQTGKNIYIISDSDKYELGEVLKKYSIKWKALSKFTLRGSILETVIDNLSAEQFKKSYLIDFKTFINVKDLVK